MSNTLWKHGRSGLLLGLYLFVVFRDFFVFKFVWGAFSLWQVK